MFRLNDLRVCQDTQKILDRQAELQVEASKRSNTMDSII